MPGQPSGTVTFLFTDIEGSSQRWERYPAVMHDALARHNEILSRAIHVHGGVVFKTVGDAFCAAFSTAPAALSAALSAQHALTAEPWNEDCVIRVRMALHTGAAYERGEDYFGPPVNRVARLLATAHGGQVVLSDVVQELVRDSLPTGVGLIDLGEHRLKDLFRPERVFQLVAPDLPNDFPPLRTLDTQPNNLPVQPTPFIGRDRELKRIAEILCRPAVRLLTLTGVGGTGKSRLGVQVAADLLDHFKDGVFFVPLDLLTDPALVPSALAASLDVQDTSSSSHLEALKRHLRRKQILLVLDNCEHVLDACSVVGELLMTCPTLKVLATSRAILHLAGEHEYPVPPLLVPNLRQLTSVEMLTQFDALALFHQRARAVRPDFEVTSENAAAIVEICYRLDGLPLAIELAAARIRLFPPAALLSRLSKRLPLLTGGARDVPARQQTLRGAIAWSYDLLSAEQQKLFARVAAFTGGCTLDAAETVCNFAGDLPEGVISGVEALVEQSLLRQTEQPDGEPRFLMLETIREYALEQLLARGETNMVFERQAQYCAQFAEEAEEQLTGPKQRLWLERLEQEHDNIRAALRWALDHGEAEVALRLGGAFWRFWIRRGNLREGRAWLDEMLAHADTAEPRSRAKVLNAAGVLALHQHDFGRAKILHEQTLSLWRELGDAWGEAASLNNLANVARNQGDTKRAAVLFEECLALRRQQADTWGIAATLNNLATLAREEGDTQRATALVQESLELQRQLADRRGIATALSTLGALAQDAHEYQRAAALHEESVALRRELGDDRGTATSLSLFAAAAHDAGDRARAERAYQESVALRRELGDQREVASGLSNLARIAHEAGEHRQARALYEESLSLWRGLGDVRGIAATLERLARIARDQGDLSRAAALYEECLTEEQKLGDQRRFAVTARRLADVVWEQGDLGGATELYEQSTKLLRRLDDKQGVSISLRRLASVAEAQGEKEKANQLLEESLSFARAAGDSRGITEALRRLQAAGEEAGDTETPQAHGVR